ncbi:MAG: AraC family transcriptional regulator [Clostridia bacterium]|nr:AraC family transcriptional regulator [Clostridia bacterium]
MDLSRIPVIFEHARKDENGYFLPSLCHLGRDDIRFLHYHDVLEIGLCISGSGYCYANGQKTPFREGDVQLFLPNQPHYDTAGDDNALWTFVNIEPPRITSPHLSPDPAFIIGLMGKIRVSGIFREDEHPGIHRAIRDIIGLMQSTRPTDSPAAELMTAKLTALLIELSMIEESNTTVIESPRADVIVPALHLVSSAISRHKSITVGQMAEVCFMSESYFRKIFSSVMGESPKSYIVRQQIQKAAGLLVTTKAPIAEIASRCGFEDVSTFYRRFVKICGVSPTKYRRAD